MSNPSDPLEPVYGVQLFDDLHVYLPDLLYNPNRFATVQDLLQYVRQQTRAHFNLYNRGVLQYQQQQERLAREVPLQLPRRVRTASVSAELPGSLNQGAMPYSRAQVPESTAEAPSVPATATTEAAPPPAPRYAPAPPLITPLLSAPLRSAVEAVLAPLPSALPVTADVGAVDISGQNAPVTPPRPASSSSATASVTASATAAGGAGAGTTSTTSSTTTTTPLFTTTYARQRFNTASGRTVQNTPFLSPRAVNSGFEFGAPFRTSYPPNTGLEFGPPTFLGFGVEGVGDDPLGGLGNTNQLLTSLLGLAFGDAGVATTGLPASFLEPVVVRPTIAQIDAASEVLTLSAPLEGNCAVCQDALETDNQVRRLNACGHSFHQECIDTWFERSVQCPVCRHDVREPATAPANAEAEDAAPEQPPELD